MTIADVELGRLMAEAARRATDAAIAAGHGRGDKITRDSAYAAALEVHRAHRPEDFYAAPVVHDEIRADDPVKDRIDREIDVP